MWLNSCQYAGVDAVGFVFYPESKRAITPDKAATLCRYLGPWQMPVALFVNPSATMVKKVLQSIPNALLQFHGDESTEFCESFKRPYIKAIRMADGVDLFQQCQVFASAQGLLLDSWSVGFGGSGHAFNWSVLPNLNQLSLPCILSGGLNLQNIQAAMTQLKPYGVDLSSGVEVQPGHKSANLITSFCAAVREIDTHTMALSNHNLRHN